MATTSTIVQEMSIQQGVPSHNQVAPYPPVVNQNVTVSCFVKKAKSDTQRFKESDSRNLIHEKQLTISI